MLVKFFNGGKGKGGGLVDYLTRERDGKGAIRESLPEVLKGDPEQIVKLIDVLDFEYKYQAGVISFAPEDAPSEEQQREAISSFEKTAFAGLEADRYDILWVRHSHTSGGRIELHFVTPRVELETGKSLNIAPPGWQNYFRPWRDYWNYSQGWARPDDPERARAYHPGYHALVQAEEKRLELAGIPCQNREDYRQTITNYLIENIQLGRIKQREDIISLLEESGLEITRKGEDYLTVTNEKIGKKIRLKGGIYEASWRLGEGLTKETGNREKTDRELTQTRIREAETELTNRMLERAEYHQSRYRIAQAKDDRPNQVVLSPTNTLNYEPLNRFLDRQLGDGAIAHQTSTRNPTAAENSRKLEKQNVGSGTIPKRNRQISDSPKRLGSGTTDRMDLQRQTLLEAVREEDERTRKRTTTNLQELCQTIREGQTRTERTNRAITEANQIIRKITNRIEPTSTTITASLSRHHQTISRIAMNREEELERFKREINLVEYAQSQGYQIDNQKSSQNCIVLTENAGDKLLIGIDAKDSHYFYYSVRDDRDTGSIIDFIQKRKNWNLGEIRRELRPWLNINYEPINTSTNKTKKPIPISKNRAKIVSEFENFKPTNRHPYLNARGISQQTSASPRFEGTIYSDERGNAIFPHRDREGVCGYEIRNRGFKGFSRGGSKGLWVSNSESNDLKLVVCESPLDCLSYHQLFPTQAKTRYFATGGTISEKQKDLLSKGFEKIHEKGGQIILAMDADEAGNKLALELTQIAPRTAQILRHVPNYQKDWNEALNNHLEGETQQNQNRRRGLER
jgi:hypothetical protein